jgi:drug/metabolite transporter superfamily protein YnfA
MNPRAVTAVAGIVTLAFGVAGLVYPDRVMGLLGFAILNTAQAAAVLGEVRATYGGLFTVIGVFTLLAALDPVAQRARILFIGTLWLGLCGGRLLGANVDGSPGLPGWAAAIFELVVGAALVAASFSARPKAPAGGAPAAAPPVAPPPAVPPQVS